MKKEIFFNHTKKASEVNTKILSQNGISAKRISYYGIDFQDNGNDASYESISRIKEDILILTNKAAFVPRHNSMKRNIPFDLNTKLMEILVLPRYQGTFVMSFLNSILHINPITFKSVAETIMRAIEQTEHSLKLKVLTPEDITYTMFETVRSTALKKYMQRFVNHSNSSVEGASF